MKALKIYSIFSTIAIIVLSIGLYQTNKGYIKAKKNLKGQNKFSDNPLKANSMQLLNKKSRDCQDLVF